MKRPNKFSLKQEYMERHLDDLKILIMGDSHLEEGISPNDIRDDSIYNFAFSAVNYFWTEQYARRYIPRMKNLETVILPIGYGLGYLNKQRHFGPDPTFSFIRCMNYKYMHLSYNPWTDWLYWPEIIHSNIKVFRVLKSYNPEMLCGLTPSELDSLKGYVPLPFKRKSDDWESIHLPPEMDFTKKYEVFPKCLDSIASICQERGIRLILISIPQWKSAQEVMTQEGLEKKDELVKDLMDRYPCVEYHDYIFDERFTADDFDDAAHLNEFGAPKFTKILKHDLNL